MKKLQQIRSIQIILEIKKNGELITEFLGKVYTIVFNLQSTDRKISDKLKIAKVFKPLRQEYEPFIAEIQFRQISYQQLKERLIERSLG